MTKPTYVERSLNLPDWMWQQFREIADEQMNTVNGVIRQVLAAHLRESGPRTGDGPAPGFEQRAFTPLPPAETPLRDRWVGLATAAHEPAETRDPSDEEARLLREAYPNLKAPKVVDPNAGRKR